MTAPTPTPDTPDLGGRHLRTMAGLCSIAAAFLWFAALTFTTRGAAMMNAALMAASKETSLAAKILDLALVFGPPLLFVLFGWMMFDRNSLVELVEISKSRLPGKS